MNRIVGATSGASKFIGRRWCTIPCRMLMHSTAGDAMCKTTTAHDTGKTFVNINHLHFESNYCFNQLNFYISSMQKDIEDRVARTLPTLIDKWALAEAREQLDKSKRKKLVLPFNQIQNLLQKVCYFIAFKKKELYLKISITSWVMGVWDVTVFVLLYDNNNDFGVFTRHVSKFRICLKPKTYQSIKMTAWSN